MAAIRSVEVTDKQISEIELNLAPQNRKDLCKNTKSMIRLRLGDYREYSPRIRLGEYVRVNYREGGLYVIYSPEDAQRPRAVYHIQPNFEVIN
jgi:hypothetical protein